jgi:hypothetical protein
MGPKSLCDIAEAIRYFRGEMDWAQVAQRAREWGASRYVGLTLCLARSMLDVGVPDDVMERLIPEGLDMRVLEGARHFVLARTGYGRWLPILDMAGAKSLSDKAKLFWGRVFLSPDEMAAKYPMSRDSKRRWFYAALRLKDALRTLWLDVKRRGLPVVRSRGQDRNIALVNWLRSGKPVRQAKVKAELKAEAEAKAEEETQ